ncbi:Plug domain-containing protein [Riemerella anatipestifer]|nr:Plug domain-containing protein [Riemerella anatipestifer]
MKRKSFLLLAGVATFYFNNTFAQTTQKDSVKVNNVEEVIITGSANPKKRIESSIAITTMKAKDIQQKAPQSTADILQYVPGFLAENSGVRLETTFSQEVSLPQELMNMFRFKKTGFLYLKTGHYNLPILITFKG